MCTCTCCWAEALSQQNKNSGCLLAALRTGLERLYRTSHLDIRTIRVRDFYFIAGIAGRSIGTPNVSLLLCVFLRVRTRPKKKSKAVENLSTLASCHKPPWLCKPGACSHQTCFTWICLLCMVLWQCFLAASDLAVSVFSVCPVHSCRGDR